MEKTLEDYTEDYKLLSRNFLISHMENLIECLESNKCSNKERFSALQNRLFAHCACVIGSHIDITFNFQEDKEKYLKYFLNELEKELLEVLRTNNLDSQVLH